MMDNGVIDKILIIDFGSQLTQLIARRIRESGVYCEIFPYNILTIEFINNYNPIGIVLSGGPDSVHKAETPRAPNEIFSLKIPVLGICYGQQTMVSQLGGEVIPSKIREFGRAILTIQNYCELFDDFWHIDGKYPVWMSHGDMVASLPEGFLPVATTEHSPYAITVNEEKKFYAVQFHPEVVHTQHGAKLLMNFTHKICGASGKWSMSSFRDAAISKIRKHVKKDKIICGLSGGVDSSVVSILLHEAVGKQLTCVFIDNGLMRKNESNEVISLFAHHYNIPLIHRDASDIFLDGLSGVEDPEEKRKIIGKIFIEVFEEEAKKLGDVKFLAQGTLYPDVIESVSNSGGASVTIKSHHNVGGLPERMQMQLVEPVRDLFKDEVRLLGEELGLPEAFVKRHPFPGPGLAIRVPGAIDRGKLEILREADEIFLQEIHKSKLYDEIWQAFVVLLPVQSVGVMGDQRTYEYVCALRAVTSNDGMTADFFPFSSSFLANTANRITNEVKGINRVVFDITSKPPGTIEWE